jgi:hypothetical protein
MSTQESARSQYDREQVSQSAYKKYGHGDEIHGDKVVAGDFVGREQYVHYYTEGFPMAGLAYPVRKQLDSSIERTRLNVESVIAKGIARMALALKAERQGFRLAVVDDEGLVIADVVGVTGNLPVQDSEQTQPADEGAVRVQEQTQAPMAK